LLNGRVKGIEVGMQNRRPPRWRYHPGEYSRTYVRFPATQRSEDLGRERGGITSFVRVLQPDLETDLVHGRRQ
jgi:hypothetical protein